MVCPATVKVPERRPGPVGFAVRLNVTEPLPVVPGEPLIVAHGTLELEVQLHPDVVATGIVTKPPDTGAVPGGVTVKVQPPCVPA